MQKQIEIAGVTFDVDYTIIQGDRRTNDYPGSDDEIELISVEVGGIDFMEFLADYPELEQRLIDKILR